MVLGQILDEAELPLRLTALTPCFRSEAGASGRDTRGMIRQHQFYKVEWCRSLRPSSREAEHERMVECAEKVLKRLELPFRTMLLCTATWAFPRARPTIWRSGCRARRCIARFPPAPTAATSRPGGWTPAAKSRREGRADRAYLNGSGLAVGRTLVALLENYQDEGGRIAIPQALQPYMGGVSHIGENGWRAVQNVLLPPRWGKGQGWGWIDGSPAMTQETQPPLVTHPQALRSTPLQPFPHRGGEETFDRGVGSSARLRAPPSLAEDDDF